MARILIAEDDASMREFLALALRKAGYEVDTREDGLSALDAVKDGASYDLLLADIVMPGMDGIELAKNVSAIAPATKVMFITGFAAVIGQTGDTEAIAATRILSKPFHLKDLVDQVERLLAA